MHIATVTHRAFSSNITFADFLRNNSGPFGSEFKLIVNSMVILNKRKIKKRKMNDVNIRLELGINAQKFIQQVQLYHGTIEEQIGKGIELALNDLCEGDNFVQSVREATKLELSKIVNKAFLVGKLKVKSKS